jgi:recombination protein RecT
MAQTARPQLVSPRTEEGGTLRQIFENPKVVNKLSQAVPRHLNPQRMLRVLALAVQNTPKLAQAEPMTLLGAMMVCSSLGLEPNTPLGHAYLIPFDRRRKRGNEWIERTEINLIIGYKGFIDLARRSGQLVSMHADVVYGAAELGRTGDQFSFEYGSGMHLRHVPMGDREGPRLWAYAHAKLKDGEAFEVLPYALVLKIRDGSEAYKYALANRGNPRIWDTSPWVAYEHEMSSKTMIRRLAKMLPLSIEFANAAALDAMSETGAADLAAIASDGFDLARDEVFEIEHQQSGEGQEAPPPTPSAGPMATNAGDRPDDPRARPAAHVAPDRTAPSTAPAEGVAAKNDEPNPEQAPPDRSREATPQTPTPSESAPRRRGRINFET